MPFYQGKKDFGDRLIGSPSVWTTQPTKVTKAGDILMSVRAPVGPVNFATSEVCIGRGLAAIRPRPDLVDGDFLFFHLQYLEPLISGSEGAVFPSLSRRDIQSLEISCPSLLEQRRIVDILDEAFAGIAVARANVEKNLQNARAIFQCHLDSVFAQRREGWTDTILERVLATQPQNGWSPPAANHSATGTPVLTLSAVTGFHFRPDKVKFTSASTDSERSYWVKNGDLLITRSNTPELVGHVAIASGIDRPTIYPDLIMRMNPMGEVMSTKLLYYQLRTTQLRHVITERAQGANPTMKKISNGGVRTLPILVPPMTAQIEVIEVLDGLASETALLTGVCQRKLAALDELKHSLLHRAFTGQLTKMPEADLEAALA